MAKQTTTSTLAGKLGAKGKQAVEKHRGDETKLAGGGDLPAGIDGGIAKLVDCRFGIYKEGEFKGQYFYLAAAIVVSPEEHAGIPTKGLRTQVGPEPMCDTPKKSRKTVDDHVAYVLNEYRKMGADVSEAGIDDLEDIATALKESGIYIRFRTWKGDATPEFPNPRVNHDWRGIAKDYAQDESDGVVDETEEEPSAEAEPSENGDGGGNDWHALAAAADDNEDKDAMTKLKGEAAIFDIDSDSFETWAEVVAAMEEKNAADAEEDNGTISFEEMGRTADAGEDEDASQAAMDALVEAGKEHELKEEDYESWEAFGTAIDEAEAGGETEETEEEAPFSPDKGDVFDYKPKGSTKKFECEVMAIDKKASTVTLKQSADGKTLYKNVPWSALTTPK